MSRGFYRRLAISALALTALGFFFWLIARLIRKAKTSREESRDAECAAWAQRLGYRYHRRASPLALAGLKYLELLRASAREPIDARNLVAGERDGLPFVCVDYQGHHPRDRTNRQFRGQQPYRLNIVVIKTGLPMPEATVMRPTSIGRRFQREWGLALPQIDASAHAECSERYEVRGEDGAFSLRCAEAVERLAAQADQLAYEFSAGSVAVVPAISSLTTQTDMRPPPPQMETMLDTAVALAKNLSAITGAPIAPQPAGDSPIIGGIPPERDADNAPAA